MYKLGYKDHYIFQKFMHIYLFIYVGRTYWTLETKVRITKANIKNVS